MPQDVKASFEYLRWTDLYKSVKPYAILGAVPDGLPETNMEFRAASAERIEDVRGREHTFTLEQQGFAIKKSAMPLSHFDADAVEREYPGYVEEIVRELVGSNAEVVMFDWRVCLPACRSLPYVVALTLPASYKRSQPQCVSAGK